MPASSANLGPGFDTLGLALGLYLRCRFQPAAKGSIRAAGRDAERIPTGEDNLILQTARQVASCQGRELPPVAMEIQNEIPVGKGFGSSAAALVAGVVLADSALDLNWDEHRLLDEAARIEGHPDNVSAAVLGSVTTAAIGDDGITRAVRLEVPRAFSVAAVCPDFELSTPSMREALPSEYSRKGRRLQSPACNPAGCRPAQGGSRRVSGRARGPPPPALSGLPRAGSRHDPPATGSRSAGLCAQWRGSGCSGVLRDGKRDRCRSRRP